MNGKKYFHNCGLGKCTRWNLFVPIGAMLMFLLFAAFPQNEETPVPGVKKPGSKTEKTEKAPPADMQEIMDLLGKLKELGGKRAALKDRQERLLDQLPELKEGTGDENLKPDKIMARKELEKTAGELHKSLEQDRRFSREQHAIVRKLMGKKEAAMTVIAKEKKTLEGRLQKARKESEPSQEKLDQLKYQIEDLEKIQATLDILEKNPDALQILGLRPGDRMPTRESEEWYPGKYFNRRTGRQPMERADLERAGGRIWQQVMSLQKQVRFLKGEVDRAETELNNLQAIVKRIQERHPEFFEEIKDEPAPPPPPGEPGPPQEPDPDLEPMGKRERMKRDREEIPPPRSNP